MTGDRETMIPAGYLLKRTTPPPNWLGDALGLITEVCSVADCVNVNVVNVQAAWLHNGFGLANAPAVLVDATEQADLASVDATLFYYTAYPLALESDGWTFDPLHWRPRVRTRSAMVADDVELPSDPTEWTLLGYDVVVFGDFLEHSPLSCNGMARALPVNVYCLLDSLDAARAAIDAGNFGDGCEDGIYTIFAVHRRIG